MTDTNGMTDETDRAQRLAEIRARIAKAAEIAGRKPEDVALIAQL